MKHNPGRCNVITQQGVVTRVHGSNVDIQIVQQSACSACALKSACVGTESAERVIHAAAHSGVAVGERVLVHMDERAGWVSVALTFIVPLFIVVAVFFGLHAWVAREEFAALLGLAALVPYYYLIFRLRGVLQRAIHFWTTPIPSHLKEGSL